MTAPLTPPECDLRGLEYMPLLGQRLFGSEFDASATDAEWRAGLTLWWAAWTQCPAGSLPADDAALCRLADLGRDRRRWQKVRDRALHGFILCTDGRIYHPVLCTQALIAWDKRIKERDRKAQWRERKQQLSENVPRDGTRTETGTEQGRDATVPADETGRDGTRRDNKEETPIGVKRARVLPADFEPVDGDGRMAEIAARWSPQKRSAELERWRAHHIGKGSRMIDWNAAWRTWIGNSERFGSTHDRNGANNGYGLNHSGIPI